ncbi:MAG: putative zinc-binding metallopeptidase [Verrucomicrobiota bacterium]
MSLFFARSPIKPSRDLPVCSCGALLFRENTACITCGAPVGHVPDATILTSFTILPDRRWKADHPELRGRAFKPCTGRNLAHQCNWMIEASDPASQCLSCSLTRTIPDLTVPGAPERWAMVEHAKRQVIIQLLRLEAPVKSKLTDADGVCFDLLEPQAGPTSVMTGHEDGVITLNLNEADPARRTATREMLGERYRTLAGHLRHEMAHYYWDLLAQDPDWADQCREVFGDERADYGAALQRHHQNGAPADWSLQFISPYASSHPWEDWAECFAHYLHMEEGLETASQLGIDLRRLHLRAVPFDRAVLGKNISRRSADKFLDRIDRWVLLGLATNELNAALGHDPAYPFVLNAAVVNKLHFIQESLITLGER